MQYKIIGIQLINYTGVILAKIQDAVMTRLTVPQLKIAKSFPSHALPVSLGWLLGTFSAEPRPVFFLLLKYHNAINPSMMAITPIVTPAPIPPAAALLSPKEEVLEEDDCGMEPDAGDVELVDAFPDPVQNTKLELQMLHHDASEEMPIADIEVIKSVHGISVEL